VARVARPPRRGRRARTLTVAVGVAGLLAGAGLAGVVDADVTGIATWARGAATPSASPAGDVGAAPAVAEAPSPTPAPATPDAAPTGPAPTAVGIDLALHSTTDLTSLWVVVNKQHPVSPSDYAPADLVTVAGAPVRAVVAPDLRAMVAAARADGVRLSASTAYRSYGFQAYLHADLVRRMGAAYADRYSARPGYSEHQTGLALDLHSASQPSCDLRPCFAGTVEAAWVAAHAWEYGFVVRYTADNTVSTGYEPEAWHVRYVGRDLAAWMHANGVRSLEDAFGVSGGPDYAAD
jgi:D-alanyl-D-alanine carboxypeptidase